MASIDLKKKTGLPLQFKNNEIQSKDFRFSKSVQYNLADLRDHLINQTINCPACFYSRYISIDHDDFFKGKNLKLNFYLIQPGIAGIEYIKTHVYILKSYPKILEISHGSGIILMQDPETDKIYLSRVRDGNKIIIPPNFKFELINVKLYVPLIACELYSYDARNYRIDEAEENIPYYIISKNSKPAVVKNPDFLNVGKYYRIKAENIGSKYGMSAKLPIVKQVLRKYEKFNWLFEKNIEIDL